MRQQARPTRENRTITVDFRDEATYFQLLGDGKAFLECVIAFVMSLGFQLKHKATCSGGGGLTRHSHHVRVRLGGLSIWRILVYNVQSGVHCPPSLRHTLSLDAPRRGPQRPISHPWRTEFRAVRGDVSHFADGTLSPRLCA